MGYAEVYRRRMSPWRRGLRYLSYAVVFGVLLYFSIHLLGAQSGLMMGGTISGSGPQGVSAPAK
jgi:hypothetical protein